MYETAMIFFFYITSLLIKIRHVLSFKRQIIKKKKNMSQLSQGALVKTGIYHLGGRPH